jgi:hypothetical protein
MAAAHEQQPLGVDGDGADRDLGARRAMTLQRNRHVCAAFGGCP